MAYKILAEPSSVFSNNFIQDLPVTPTNLINPREAIPKIWGGISKLFSYRLELLDCRTQEHVQL